MAKKFEDETVANDVVPSPGVGLSVAELRSTKAALDALPKVWVRIPLPPEIDDEELAKMKKPPHTPVCINGYTYDVPHGVDVQVPDAVANLLREARYL